MGRMFLRHEADLARGGPARFNDQMRLYALFASEHVRKVTTSIISTDYAYNDATSAKAGNIAGHITGASDHQLPSRYRQDRRGRLGRDAGHFAIDEIVEHQIPDAEHGLLGNELKRLFEIEHQVRTPQPYCRSGDSPLSRGLLPYGGFPRIESDFSRLKSYSTEELNSTSWRLR